MVERLNNSNIYKTAIIIFVILVIAQFSEIKIAGLIFDIFLKSLYALYIFIFMLLIYIFSVALQKIYGIGNSLFLFYLALIYAGNFIVALNFSYDMPIHILITAPLVYFSSIYLFTNYFESVRTLSSNS